MKLSIHRETSCGPEELRALLIDAAEQLAGPGSRVLEPKLPWDGHPVLLADAELHPVLVSFDIDQSEMALMNGLIAVEKLCSALAWVNQVYEVLQHREQPPKLVVVSAEYPPGAGAILAACPQLRLFQYKMLSINNETGLWLEPLLDKSPVATTRIEAHGAVEHREEPPPARVSPFERPAEDELPSLSSEETAYFQQL